MDSTICKVYMAKTEQCLLCCKAMIAEQLMLAVQATQHSSAKCRRFTARLWCRPVDEHHCLAGIKHGSTYKARQCSQSDSQLARGQAPT